MVAAFVRSYGCGFWARTQVRTRHHPQMEIDARPRDDIAEKR